MSPTTRSIGFTSWRDPLGLPFPRGDTDGIVDECLGWCGHQYLTLKGEGADAALVGKLPWVETTPTYTFVQGTE